MTATLPVAPPAPDSSPPEPRTPRRGPVRRIAGWSVRHRWLALGLWLVFVVGALGAGQLTGTVLQENDAVLTGESAKAERLVDSADFGEKATESVLIQARDGRLSPADVDGVLVDLRREYAGLDIVDEISTPVRAEDGRTAMVPVTLTGDPDDADDIVAPMLAATDRVAGDHRGLRVEQVGSGSIGQAFDQVMEEDFKRAELISIPLTFVVLLLVFGALVAAGVPLLLGLTSIATAMGLAAVASRIEPANPNQGSLILLIGLAVGVDYALFAVQRVRRERRNGLSTPAALDVAAATAGRAVAVSGVAVVIAMSGMFIAGNALFTSFAIGTILVVAVAVVGSLTVLPAVLALVGDRLNSPRIPLLHRLASHREESRFWSAVLRPVLARPAVALVLGIAAVGALAVPGLMIHTAMPTEDDLPKAFPVTQAYDRLVAAFPAERNGHVVVVRADASQAPAVKDALVDLHRRVGADGRFTLAAEPNIQVSTDSTTTTLELPFAGRTDSERARDTLSAVRTGLAPAALDSLPDAEWAVGGEAAFNFDFSDQLDSRLPWVVAFVLALTFVAMVAAFRSIPVALVTVALNGLSVLAAFGVLVLIFQDPALGTAVGLESTGSVTSWLPLLLFVVLFGLSMDYHVFVLSRIREGIQAGMSPTEAIRHGVSTSAGVVTSAAVIMVVVFSVFATLSMVEMQQLGIGLAAAILLDATVVRGLLLPSALAVLGRWAWPGTRPARGADVPKQASFAGR